MKKFRWGDKIKELRTQRAWTQEQLAQIVQVDVRTIQRVESGKVASMETLKALASAFDLDVGELMRTQEEAKSAASASYVKFLERVKTGPELLSIVESTHAFNYDHEELASNQVEQVAAFFDFLTNVDILPDLPAGESVRAAASLSEQIADLEASGLWVFGLREAGTLSFPPEILERFDTDSKRPARIPWRVALIRVVRADNPTIIGESHLPVLRRSGEM